LNRSEAQAKAGLEIMRIHNSCLQKIFFSRCDFEFATSNGVLFVLISFAHFAKISLCSVVEIAPVFEDGLKALRKLDNIL